MRGSSRISVRTLLKGWIVVGVLLFTFSWFIFLNRLPSHNPEVKVIDIAYKNIKVSTEQQLDELTRANLESSLVTSGR